MLEVQKAALDTAGASRLEAIRATMGVSSPTVQPAAVEERTAEATES